MPTTTDDTIVIVILHSSDDLYGADQILLQLVKTIDRQRFCPIVVLPDDMLHVGLLSAELSKIGIEYLHLPLLIVRRRYLQPRALKQLAYRAVWGTLAVRRLVRDRNAAVVYGFTFAVLAAPLAAIFSHRPLVMHAQEVLGKPDWLRRLLHASFVRPAQTVICIAAAVRNNILGDEPSAAAKLRIVHNGLAIRRLPERSSREIRAELGLPEDQPVIGMIGRVSAWKGQSILLQAAALLRDRGVVCHCVAIGGVFDGDERPRENLLKQRTSLGMEGRFTLIDFRSDAKQLFPAFDIFVLPSVEPEPFGMVLLEAMAFAVPVVASRAGGPLEILNEARTGLFFTPGNPESLAEVLEHLMENPEERKELGLAGRRKVEESFTLERQVRQIEDILEDVARA